MNKVSEQGKLHKKWTIRRFVTEADFKRGIPTPVADAEGRPIVMGAEVVNIIGPVSVVTCWWPRVCQATE